MKIKLRSIASSCLLFSTSLIPLHVSAAPPLPAVAPARPLDAAPQVDAPKSELPGIQPRFQADAGGRKNADSVQITDDDLKKNVRLTESILNQAMIREDWDTIVSIMQFYPLMPGHDVILEGYVRGALERHDGDYGAAISTYRALTESHPDLDYVKLEMATAMFDNRQYADAEKVFKSLAETPLDIAAQRDIYMYRRAMVKQGEWNFHASIGRVFDNNVNSANGDKDIYLPQHPVYIIGNEIYVSDEVIWIPFGKDRDSRPYKDWGTLYGFSADKEKNIRGNHYATFSGGVNGKFFDRYKDYNDNSVFLAAGYKYQSARHWVSLTPQVNKRWWGSASYSTAGGGSIEYGYRPSNLWQLSLSDTYLEQRYDDRQYKGYNGRSNTITPQVIHSVNENFALFGSVSYKKEITREKAYGSRYPSATLGTYARAGQWIAGNASFTYGK
ncbi:DUF560 domain-containing protein, partial [Salmonella enterica]|nr:DUF560 domain-containing protein [Salmonella enterica]